jgi:uncharacterized membrane protein YbhN (UPF0104 family)
MAKLPSGVLPDKTRGRIVLVVALLLLLYIALPQIDAFSASVQVLREAKISLLMPALLLVAVTYGFAAGAYQVLALRLRGVEYRHTLLVQLATAFTNRLLPAGLGGMTVNARYLYKYGHTVSEAVAVVGMNTAVGMTAHLLLLAVIFLASPSSLTGQLELPRVSAMGLVIVGAALLLLLNLLLLTRLRKRVKDTATGAVAFLRHYRNYPGKLVAALACATALTICYVAVLYLCVHSVDGSLSVWQVFAIFTSGVLVGAVTPTPGGLLGVEAGLVAGLLAYGMDASPALAAVLAFRLLTYWLPLVAGLGVFLSIRNKLL